MKKLYTVFTLFMLCSFIVQAQLTTGNLVVVRLGNGTVYNGGAAARCFLDEYTTAGTFVQTIAMPITASGGNRKFMLNNGFYGGQITLSGDGRYLLVPGYDVDEFSQPLTSFTPSIAPRIVARIDKSGTVNTTTSTGAYNGESIEAAYSTNGTNIWTCGTNINNDGTGGIRYLTFGAATSTLINGGATFVGFRALGVYDNQLYVTADWGNISLASVGNGFPVTTAALSNLPGMPNNNSPIPTGFFMADLNAGITGPDVLYFLDGNAFGGATANTLSKYSLVGGTWIKNNAIAIDNPKGMTAVVTGNSVTLYVSTNSGLSKVTDATGYNTNMTAAFSSIATAPLGTFFKGVAFAPSDFPTSVRTVENIKLNKIYQRSEGELQVEFTSKKQAGVSITVTDISGKQIGIVQYKAIAGINTAVLNINGLQKAVYLVTVINGTEKTVSKFVKQ
jgi:Secretion system C-terminal sorting domain